jgi:hypothetical protein
MEIIKFAQLGAIPQNQNSRSDFVTGQTPPTLTVFANQITMLVHDEFMTTMMGRPVGFNQGRTLIPVNQKENKFGREIFVTCFL